jgi:hypothetical protein
MTYVKQICDGYNKQSLLGNWFEERLYPAQPFREQQLKQVLFPLSRPAIRMQASPASTKQATNVPCPASNEGANGKQPAG